MMVLQFPWLMMAALLVLPGSRAQSEVAYETQRDAKGPWTVHLVRVPRQDARFRLQSLHAKGTALGLATVTAQTKIPGFPLAALNGDFYERAGSYAGDPRGLQIVESEMISAPAGSPSFWVDAASQPHLGETYSRLEISVSGMTRPSLLNAYRETNQIVLFTPAIGASTRARGGREIVLEQIGNERGLQLRPGRTVRLRAREVREEGDSPLSAEKWVLSIGPAVGAWPQIKPGDEILVSIATEPSLRGVRTAISGGPTLVRNGKRLRIQAPDKDSYEFSTMMERHPRSGIGWNANFYFLAAVDGRQKGGSAGMTLDEFAAWFVKLGCDEALNLDGGGSSTLWFDGKVRNFLCDGYEREIANSIVVTKSEVKRR